MKTNFRLLAVTLTLLSASLAGCLGGDDDDDGGYSGPIDLVVFYDSTSGNDRDIDGTKVLQLSQLVSLYHLILPIRHLKRGISQKLR